MSEREKIVTLLNQAADRHGVDRRYVQAIAHIESRHRQFTNDGNILTSRVGAMGVMQLMPTTAQGLGVNPRNLEGNIEGGVRYFRQRIDLAGGDIPTAIAMYYAGIGNVQRRGALQWAGVQRYIHNFQNLINSESILSKASSNIHSETMIPTIESAPAVQTSHFDISIFVIVFVLIVIFFLIG